TLEQPHNLVEMFMKFTKQFMDDTIQECGGVQCIKCNDTGLYVMSETAIGFCDCSAGKKYRKVHPPDGHDQTGQ
ncbi:MAG: hypothetical protein ABIH46_06255, partial [Chloroflexota bacterium]